MADISIRELRYHGGEVVDRVALISRPYQRVAPVVFEATEDAVTGVAGIALFGELLDHLGLADAADRRGLRPNGPGGYSGGECYRPVVELQLARRDFARASKAMAVNRDMLLLAWAMGAAQQPGILTVSTTMPPTSTPTAEERKAPGSPARAPSR